MREAETCDHVIGFTRFEIPVYGEVNKLIRLSDCTVIDEKFRFCPLCKCGLTMPRSKIKDIRLSDYPPIPEGLEIDRRDLQIYEMFRSASAPAREIGAAYGLSTSRVFQIANKILIKIGQHLNHPKVITDDTPIIKVTLSCRAYYALVNAGIKSVGEYRQKEKTTVMRWKNVGRLTYDELESVLCGNPPLTNSEYWSLLRGVLPLSLAQRTGSNSSEPE